MSISDRQNLGRLLILCERIMCLWYIMEPLIMRRWGISVDPGVAPLPRIDICSSLISAIGSTLILFFSYFPVGAQ